MIEDIRETRLDNGVVVLTDRMPHVRSATLGFFFRVGARDEPAKLNGITHFIEHAVFKGTARRTALDIAIEQDRLGGNLDAFTTHEETGFAIKVTDDRIEQAFDLLADMLMSPTFEQSELDSEQRVIIEEIKMVEDSPEDHLGEIFNQEFFAGTALSLAIPGTPETVCTFDRETTASYHKRAFAMKNLVIVAAGNVGHDEFVALASRRLAGAEDGDARSGRPWGRRRDAGGADGGPVASAPIVIKQNETLEQAHLVIATPFVAGTDERRYAADLLTNILGGGTSSRLWQKVREQRGLAYNVGAGSAMYRDAGVFSIFAATSPEQAEEVIEIAVAELGEIVRNGVARDELDLAKQQARASILLSLEDSASRAAA
ncbi:MAG: insulinase family protein, partial [Acidobacteria bacterium]|nr:insulinase family protein [Acidobacteriota bacterium]MCA1609079.1 insulinase family protein [Acidobacteriota bacterium]